MKEGALFKVKGIKGVFIVKGTIKGKFCAGCFCAGKIKVCKKFPDDCAVNDTIYVKLSNYEVRKAIREKKEIVEL